MPLGEEFYLISAHFGGVPWIIRGVRSYGVYIDRTGSLLGLYIYPEIIKIIITI